ncbi:MAG: response regulator, partial [Chloroflexota bacterium]
MKKILLVEDNVDLAADIEETLQVEGYTVFLAYNGQEALTIIHDSHPDIVISDNEMPIMSGLE